MTVSNPKSQNEFRTIVAETIVLHGLHFSFVEWSGVRKMIGYCTDEFHMVSRNTAKADVLSLYGIEKTKVNTLLEEAPGRICLTSDLWTSIATDDGLKEIEGFVHKVRESVKYARASQTRKQKFIECIKRVHLDSKRGLRQDVPTIWNSTYLMLDSAIYYRLAWTALELADSNYKHFPSESEWENVEKFYKFLRHFYDTTNLFLGTKYPTFYHLFALM
ncbi:hypothetical protein Ddye_005440 [Dipteronia dyeriana]|uniref:Uncharacterized protein n=1 Tax=Dipteronia dyeriana TaxID=168575 RepID=A0AAD9XGM9_9ROSI|nr:hypothetical protein Ddye_005440 [Dipteronia dyeriana]